MADSLFMAHSGLRYLVLAAGVVVLIAALVAMRGSTTAKPARAANRLFRGFVIVLDLQVVLGLAVVFLRPFHPMYIGHIVMMLGALTVAHMFAMRLRKAAPETRSAGLIVTGTLLALVLIIGGILAIQRPIL